MKIQNVDIKLPSGDELCVSDIRINEQRGVPVSGKIYFSSNELKRINLEAHKAGNWQAIKAMTLSFFDDDTFYKLEILLDKTPVYGENPFNVSKILNPIND